MIRRENKWTRLRKLVDALDLELKEIEKNQVYEPEAKKVNGSE